MLQYVVYLSVCRSHVQYRYRDHIGLEYFENNSTARFRRQSPKSATIVSSVDMWA